MAEKLGVFWMFNRSFTPTALTPKIYGERNGWPQTYPLVVAVSFVHRTIEVGYAYEMLPDWPVGSTSPEEIYLFARDALRPHHGGEDIRQLAPAEWQKRLSEVLEVVNAELQTAEITDAFKNKIKNYFLHYDRGYVRSEKGRFELVELLRNNDEIVGYYIRGPKGALPQTWEPDEINSALSTLKGLAEGGRVEQFEDSILA